MKQVMPAAKLVVRSTMIVAGLAAVCAMAGCCSSYGTRCHVPSSTARASTGIRVLGLPVVGVATSTKGHRAADVRGAVDAMMKSVWRDSYIAVSALDPPARDSATRLAESLSSIQDRQLLLNSSPDLCADVRSKTGCRFALSTRVVSAPAWGETGWNFIYVIPLGITFIAGGGRVCNGRFSIPDVHVVALVLVDLENRTVAAEQTVVSTAGPATGGDARWPGHVTHMMKKIRKGVQE